MGRIGRGEVGVEDQVRVQERPRLVRGVLIDQQWGVGGIHQHPGGLGIARRGHGGPQEVAVVGDVSGPDHGVAGKDPGPLQPLDPLLHPVHQRVVLVLGLSDGVQLLGLRRAGRVDLDEPVSHLLDRVGNQFRPSGRHVGKVVDIGAQHP